MSNKVINFEIHGGRKLSGSVDTNTSKNSAVVLLCASLLNKNKTILKKMPRIEEVYRIIEVLESIGVKVNWKKGSDLEIIPPKKINLSCLNTRSAVKTRSIMMFLGPLVHLFKQFRLPHAGGCRLGKRTVAPHFFALERMGVKITALENSYRVSVKNLKPAEIILYESGDTVTANAIMAAAKIPGKTILKFASANYQVQDLCFFLMKFGVQIEGVGTTTLVINGVSEMDSKVEYYPSEDPIETMLFLSIAATTNSSLMIKRCPIDFLELELFKLEKMSFKYRILKRYKANNKFTNLVDIKTLPSKLVALEEKIYARPFPGLNIDNLPFFVPIATQAKGKTLIHDWVYEGRAIYYQELSKLGANILLADPHRVFVEGPTKLKSAKVVCPPALRPAAIIFIGMLAAKGVSVLKNVYSINRGYEDLSNRLNKLGARIKMFKE